MTFALQTRPAYQIQQHEKDKKAKEPKDTALYGIFSKYAHDGVFTFESMERMLRDLMRAGLDYYEMTAKLRKWVLGAFTFDVAGKRMPVYDSHLWICENKIKDEIYYYGIDMGLIDDNSDIRGFIDRFLRGSMNIDAGKFEQSKARYAKKHQEKYSLMLQGRSSKPNYQQVDVNAMVDDIIHAEAV
ncbi:MAG TPA: hypothetical protein PLZ78_09000 [Spirochaetota bacterium]|nr:hypothetical protein [Spirochaetota bacterium]